MTATETRPPKGYRHGTFVIERWELVEGERKEERAEVAGLVHACGYLGLHKPVVEGFGLWSVSHLPSGKLIATVPTQAAGRQLIGSLAASGHLASTAPNFSALSQAWGLVSNLRSQWALTTTTTAPPRRSRKRQDAPLSFSPVFPANGVPTAKARAALNRAAVALGTGDPDVFRFMEEAAALQQREEIVVRVTQPPRAIMLESDIPPSISPGGCAAGAATSTNLSKTSAILATGTTLRDGTPATPEEFKRRYHLLLELGDRLRAGSLIFQRLFAEGEAEGWTVARLEKWERLDERFRSIVCEGWMVWSGAAFCLAVAPPVFLQNVEAKLGYVGGKNGGWTELGIKTFLRYPEIMAVQPLRRLMRDKIQEEL